jgi:hypothetical protein
MLCAVVHGIGVLGPGLPNWPHAARVLSGQLGYSPARTELPPPAVLPPAERRRAGRLVRLALAVGAQATEAAGIAPRELASVFSSSGGDGDNCHEICVTLASQQRALSPTRFHNSVHNAPSGYWSIAYGCQAPSTALCAHDASFGAGLLEALMQLHSGERSVLLAAYDLDYPPPLRERRPIPDAFGISLVLGADGESGGAARLTASLTDAPATSLSDGRLEALRASIPAARGLPLLAALAGGSRARVVLDYLPESRLQLEVRP